MQRYVREHVVHDFFFAQFDGEGPSADVHTYAAASTSARELREKVQQLPGELARPHQNGRKLVPASAMASRC